MKPANANARTYRGTTDTTSSTEKMSLSKSSQQNVQKPWPRKYDDNELVKYMSSLPCFLQQQMEMRNIQGNALNFGVLDWKHLEKWKYTERMPGKYPSQKKQSFSHVRNPNSGKLLVPYGMRFGSPQKRQNEDKYTNLIKSNKGKEACVKSKDSNKEFLEKEAKHLQKRSYENPQFTESRMLHDGQQAERTRNQLSDFLSPRVFKSGDLSTDKKQAETSKHVTTPTERPSTPMRRMRRSLSFKDNSAVPQLSPRCTSVMSSPDKPNASGRMRSSPIRRLLYPLLKQKGTHADETASSPQYRRPGGSTLQALLKLTLKNGLPFMKLVVNSSNDMLAAAVKSLPLYGKIDTCMIYMFYSVHEVKKKSISWINQGPKGKSCRLGYNIVGQMKISSSSDGESRECVLYGVNQAPDYIPNKEVAAVIVPNKERELFHCVSEGNKNSGGTIVILPDGIHGAPDTGEPSSLVSRFRGSCDCEGWDVGCKLRVLGGDKKGSNNLQESMLGSANDHDHLSLHLEGGGKGNKPVFILKPFSNGYYSIEFDASISLLEAFATCVAYVTCSEFPEITNTKSLSKKGKEHLCGKTKTPTTFQEQLPAYVTCPT